MTDKKFIILRGEPKVHFFNNKRHNLYRIVALRDIPSHGVIAGTIGGYVEEESNLSHEGDSWIGGDAMVCGRSIVRDNAIVQGNAFVIDSEVYDNADVFYECIVADSRVNEHANVGGRAYVLSAVITSNSRIYDGLITSTNDVVCVGPIDNIYCEKDFQIRNSFITINKKSKNITKGSFFGCLENAEHEFKFHGKEYVLEFIKKILEDS